MRTYLDCIPCVMQNLLRTARMVTDDERLQLEVLTETGKMLEDIKLEDTPPELVRDLYLRLSEITGDPDPYLSLRKESTQQALGIYPRLKQFVEEAGDPLFAGAVVASIGNLIDYGAVKHDISIAEEVEDMLTQEVSWKDFPAFRNDLLAADWVLYLGDNAGETVFDRVFIETMGKRVVYVVRGGPAINDVQMEDALDAGLQQSAEIVSSGLALCGTIPHLVSPEVQDLLASAPIIISKGQGNCETLNDVRGPIYFLLKVKCEKMSQLIDVPLGRLVLRRSLNYRESLDPVPGA